MKEKNKDFKIYSLNYLINKELTEEDLYYLYETPSLNYSLVVNMFNLYKNDIKLSISDILNICKTNERWMYEYHWTKEQRQEFLDKVIGVFKNVFYYGNTEATYNAEWWIFRYGMSVEGENLLSE